MSPTIREAQNAGAFLLAVCAIFVPYFPVIREHYIIFYYIIICQKTTPCQFPVSPPNIKNTNTDEKSAFVFFYAMFKHTSKSHLKFQLFRLTLYSRLVVTYSPLLKKSLFSIIIVIKLGEQLWILKFWLGKE